MLTLAAHIVTGGREVPAGTPGEIFWRLAGCPGIDADGYVYLCDRRRDMVISGGVKIYPARQRCAPPCCRDNRHYLEMLHLIAKLTNIVALQTYD